VRTPTRPTRWWIRYRDDPGYGWVTFAGVLLLIHGVLSLIYGLAALGNSQFVASHPRYILGTLRTWGWIGVILGVTELIVGCGVLVKNQLSRRIGVLVLGLAGDRGAADGADLSILVAVAVRGRHRRDVWADRTRREDLKIQANSNLRWRRVRS